MLNTLSMPLRKALLTNSTNVRFAYPDVAFAEPEVDGDHRTGLGGGVSPQQILAMPFCAASPQDEFVMRLYEWRLFGADNDPKLLYFPLLLAELRCVVGWIGGSRTQLLKETERFASELTLTAGSLGKNGFIINAPIAYARIDLMGGQKVRFDFAPGAQPTLFGNCLFAVTSAF